MSLEQQVEELTAVMRENAQILRDIKQIYSGAATYTTGGNADPEQQELPFNETMDKAMDKVKAKTEESVDYGELRDEVRMAMSKLKRDDQVAVLKFFEVKRLSDVPDEKLEDVLAAAIEDGDS